MFDKNFYPTSRETYNMFGLNPNGKTILEPSAGKGDMIEYLKADGAKSVLACELNDDLSLIVRQKADSFIASNFFDVIAEQISHIDMIVMNPPFDHADKHILHAWEIAPDGCEIYALLNANTLGNAYSNKRKELTAIVQNYGSHKVIGEVFSFAERTTDANIAIIQITKPRSDFNTEFADFFTDEQDDVFGNEDGGLMGYNEIRAIVQRYVRGCDDYKSLMAKSKAMYSNLAGLGITERVSVQIEYNKDVRDYEGFKKDLQKASWRFLFNKLKMDKYVTEGVKRDLNKFIEDNEKIPFTMKNIYNMIDVLIQTRSQVMERAILEAVDNYTKHTHENRYNVEGWKTNSGHMINQKIIVNGMVTANYSGSLRITHYRQADHFKDLVKAICFLTGRDYDNYVRVLEDASAPLPHTYQGKTVEPFVGSYADGADRFEPNTWYKAMDLFEIKVFKKGTAHIKFTDLKAWETLNRTYAKILGQALPEKI